MSEIEKIKRYIEKNGAPRNLRYDMSLKEALAVVHGVGGAEAVSMAFAYGKAKGYRMAKAEAQKAVQE